jgi:hypothetical protein
MADGPEAVDRPYSGHDLVVHMLDNIGAGSVDFTPDEVKELNASASAIEIQGLRLPLFVLSLSGVYCPA